MAQSIFPSFQTLTFIILPILAVLILICLIRAIRGPRIVDRIVSINMIGTIVISAIAILATYLNESYLLDVCLIYALLSFVAVIVLTKVYMGVHAERMKEEEENKQGGETDDR